MSGGTKGDAGGIGMARPKEFDRDEALDRAMQLFWSRGFEATSIQDLVEAMGINRGSLYAAFGDKHALYLAALDRFCRTAGDVEGLLGTALRETGSAKAAIRRLFVAAVDAAATGGRRGCMVVNTAVEFCPDAGDIGAHVALAMRRTEAALHGVLLQARASGEIGDRVEAPALARYLTSSLNGLRVMAKATDDRATLNDIVDVTLSVLD